MHFGGVNDKSYANVHHNINLLVISKLFHAQTLDSAATSTCPAEAPTATRFGTSGSPQRRPFCPNSEHLQINRLYLYASSSS